MPSQGPFNGAVLASDAGNGGIRGWTTPSNAQTSDDVRATATIALESVELTHWLKVTDFTSFAIPSGATIDGIQVEVEKSVGSVGLSATAEDLRTVQGGIVGGTNLGVTSGWGTVDAYTVYGGATQLWGRSWTADDINAAGFGAVIAPTGDNTAPTGSTFQVDHVRITVFYTEGGFHYSQTQVI